MNIASISLLSAANNLYLSPPCFIKCILPFRSVDPTLMIDYVNKIKDNILH